MEENKQILKSLEDKLVKRYKIRDKKTSKPKIKISGKNIFELQKIIIKKQ